MGVWLRPTSASILPERVSQFTIPNVIILFSRQKLPEAFSPNLCDKTVSEASTSTINSNPGLADDVWGLR